MTSQIKNVGYSWGTPRQLKWQLIALSDRASQSKCGEGYWKANNGGEAIVLRCQHVCWLTWWITQEKLALYCCLSTLPWRVSATAYLKTEQKCAQLAPKTCTKCHKFLNLLLTCHRTIAWRRRTSRERLLIVRALKTWMFVNFAVGLLAAEPPLEDVNQN